MITAARSLARCQALICDLIRELPDGGDVQVEDQHQYGALVIL